MIFSHMTSIVQVLMVMGGSLANGDIIDSTEILSNDVWNIIPTAKVKVTRVLNSVITIHNRVFIFGIISVSDKTCIR